MNILVSLLVVLVVAAIVYYIVTKLPFLTDPLRQIILIILAVMLLIWILNIFGLIGSGPWIWRGRG